MNYNNLWEKISFDFVKKIEENRGLKHFAQNRSKFEGWMKVEFCTVLSKYFDDITPEKDRIDIVFDNWAIELKTINTNYNDERVVRKTRPITKNIKGIIKDINDLRKNKKYQNKAVAFVVFPLPKKDSPKWQLHKNRINDRLSPNKLKEKEFSFVNGVRGVFYFGYV